MADKTDGSVVLAQLQVAFLWECDSLSELLYSRIGRPILSMLLLSFVNKRIDFVSGSRGYGYLVRGCASILSLGSGDGIPVLVGQNGVRQKKAESTYNWAEMTRVRIIQINLGRNKFYWITYHVINVNSTTPPLPRDFLVVWWKTTEILKSQW